MTENWTKSQGCDLKTIHCSLLSRIYPGQIVELGIDISQV